MKKGEWSKELLTQAVDNLVATEGRELLSATSQKVPTGRRHSARWSARSQIWSREPLQPRSLRIDSRRLLHLFRSTLKKELTDCDF